MPRDSAEAFVLLSALSLDSSLPEDVVSPSRSGTIVTYVTCSVDASAGDMVTANGTGGAGSTAT